MDTIITELKAVLSTTPGRWSALAEHFARTHQS
jgi:hypothetical protein